MDETELYSVEDAEPRGQDDRSTRDLVDRPPDPAAKPAHVGAPNPSSYEVLPRGAPNPSLLPSGEGNGKTRYNTSAVQTPVVNLVVLVLC